MIRDIRTILRLLPYSYSEVLKALQRLRVYALRRSKWTKVQILYKMEERNRARENKVHEKTDVIWDDSPAVGIGLMGRREGSKPAILLALPDQKIAAS